jgi:hypothetical protein
MFNGTARLVKQFAVFARGGETVADIDNQREVSAPESKTANASKNFLDEVFKDYQARDQQTTNTTTNSPAETKDQSGGNDVLEFPTIPGYDNQPLTSAAASDSPNSEVSKDSTLTDSPNATTASEATPPVDAPKPPAPPDNAGKTSDLFNPRSPSETDAPSNSFKTGAPGDTKTPTSSLKPLSPEDQLDDKKVSELFEGLDNSNYNVRKNAKDTLEQKMFLHPDNFQKAIDHAKKGPLTDEQKRHFQAILTNSSLVSQLILNKNQTVTSADGINELDKFAKDPERMKNRVDFLSRVTDPAFQKVLEGHGKDITHLQGELKLLKEVQTEASAEPRITKDKMPEAVKRSMVNAASGNKEIPEAKAYMEKLMKESPESIFKHADPDGIESMAERFLDKGGDAKSLMELKGKLESGEIPDDALAKQFHRRDQFKNWDEESLKDRTAFGR